MTKEKENVCIYRIKLTNIRIINECIALLLSPKSKSIVCMWRRRGCQKIHLKAKGAATWKSLGITALHLLNFVKTMTKL